MTICIPDFLLQALEYAVYEKSSKRKMKKNNFPFEFLKRK